MGGRLQVASKLTLENLPLATCNLQQKQVTKITTPQAIVVTL